MVRTSRRMRTTSNLHTTCVSGRKKRGTRKPLPKRCCCSRLIQWRRPPISSRCSSLSADHCLPSLSPPGLSDWLPSAARLPGLRASAGGSKFAAAAGDEASRSSACSSLVSTRLAVVTFFLAAANGQQQILSAAQAAVGVPGAPAFRGSPQSPAVLRVPRAAVCRASFWRGRRRVCPLYVSTVKY